MKKVRGLSESIEELASSAQGKVRKLEHIASNSNLRESWALEMGRAASALERNNVPEAAIPWLLADWSKHVLLGSSDSVG